MQKTKFAIFPYNDYSRSARALASGLGFRRPKRSDTSHLMEHYKYTDAAAGDLVVINWGLTQIGQSTGNTKVINPGPAVALCANKVKFFRKVKDVVSIPEFTESFDEAMEWAESTEVLARKSHGSCGEDIVFFSDNDISGFSSADFWVKYKKKKVEFRVHVAFGEVISLQQKALRTTDPDSGEKIDTSTVDYRIRNLRNGFVFKRNEIDVPEEVTKQALLAVQTVGLDFGAVDVIWNAFEKKAYVLEVNSAPGLEGTTLSDYVAAFKKNVMQLSA